MIMDALQNSKNWDQKVHRKITKELLGEERDI